MQNHMAKFLLEGLYVRENVFQKTNLSLSEIVSLYLVFQTVLGSLRTHGNLVTHINNIHYHNTMTFSIGKMKC